MEERTARLKDIFQQLTARAYVRAVTSYGATFSVFTDRVLVNITNHGQFDGVYEIGQFRIDINTEGREGCSRIYNLDRQVNRLGESLKFHHPHVYYDGTPCLGEIKTVIPSYLGQDEYLAVVDLLLNYLQVLIQGTVLAETLCTGLVFPSLNNKETLMKLLLPYQNQPRLEPIKPLVPRIVLSWRVYEDINHLIEECGPQELSWVGKVTAQTNGLQTAYNITAIRLLPQTSSRVHTRLDPAAIATVAYQWITQTGEADNPCRFWGHTHPGSCTEPSAQDDMQMLELIQGRCTPPFFIRGIFSQGVEQYQGEFTVYDYNRGVKFRHVPWAVANDKRRRKWTRRITKHVTFRAPGPPQRTPRSLKI
jgi:hypothetical protein